MNLHVSHIPDGFRNTGIVSPLNCDSDLLLTREGDCFVAEVLPFDISDPSYRNHFHIAGSPVYLSPGDRVPLILSYRRSMMEFASSTGEYSFRAGDNVWILGGDGYAGSFDCALREYGQAIQATIIGAITGEKSGTVRNVMDFVQPREEEDDVAADPFVVAVVGSRMDCGKSTAIRSLTAGLRTSGHHVVAGKVTGFGCRYETTGLNADSCLDFTDYGLTSTCGKDSDYVIQTARRIVEDLRRSRPDVVVLEFGGGLIGPYRVDDVVKSLCPDIDLAVFVAFDLCGVAGGAVRLQELGVSADFVTGPVANTPVGVGLIDHHHGLPAETNREGMPKLLSMIEERVSKSLSRSGIG